MKKFLWVFLIFNQLSAYASIDNKEKEIALDDNKIQGLIFINDLSKMSGYYKPAGIVVKDFIVPNKKEFISRMKKFLGKKLTIEELNQIKKDVNQFYWEQKEYLVNVFIPVNQDISSGNIQVFVLTAKLGKIKIEGAKYNSEKKIKKDLHLKEGEDINSKTLLEDITWLENDPFRSIDVIYEKGEKLGTTDVILKVKDRFPLRAYVGYENSSYRIGGSSRWKAGFNIGNLWRMKDQQLNAEFSSANDIRDWWAISGNYIIPCFWRDIIKFFGCRIHSRATPEELGLQGNGWNNLDTKLWILGFRYELRLKKNNNFNHFLTFGYDFKRTGNFFEFYKQEPDKDVDISQFLLRYEMANINSMGSTQWGLSVYVSPGNMTAFNTNKRFKEQRKGAESTYIYSILNIDRITNIGKGNWLLSAVFQLSSTRLMPIEQFSMGGHLTVRGYLENEVIGDNAILIKNEMRTQAFNFSRKLKDELQFLMFLDLGYLSNVDKHILEEQDSFLISAGPGLRYKVAKHVDVRMDWGIKLNTVQGKIFGKNKKQQVHLGAYLSF